MHTVASWLRIYLAHFEAADPPRVWRLLYLARAASVSVTTARATLLMIIVRLLPTRLVFAIAGWHKWNNPNAVDLRCQTP